MEECRIIFRQLIGEPEDVANDEPDQQAFARKDLGLRRRDFPMDEAPEADEGSTNQRKWNTYYLSDHHISRRNEKEDEPEQQSQRQSHPQPFA